MRILGIDGGIASIGWAVIDVEFKQRVGKVVCSGSRMFNSPEEQTKTGSVIKNKARRESRGARRVLRRRAQRMAKIRKLMSSFGLLENASKVALAGHHLDPWHLRSLALDQKLEPLELAICLGHIAKHRGFKSNKKGTNSNQADDDKKMLSAMEKTREKLSKYRSVGEMFYKDKSFEQRKRNREGDYTRSILRLDHEAEVNLIFSRQRQLGNQLASEQLQKEYEGITFYQRPIQSSLELVGTCPFLPNEKRASAFSPTFEKFRFLSKLINLRLVHDRTSRSLSPTEIALVFGNFSKTKGFTYKALRKTLKLTDEQSFSHVSLDKEKNDFVKSSGAAQCSKTLSDILSISIGSVEANSLLEQGSSLDEVVAIIAFHEDIDEIKQKLGSIDLSLRVQDALLDATKRGEFDFIKGTGHISNAAARRLIPHLLKGLRYDQACEAEGWDHAEQGEIKLENIKSPVAQKAAREILKQIEVVEKELGPFDRIHVEMARDVAKSIDDRRKIKKGQDLRQATRQKRKEELKKLLNKDHISGEDVLRYELWLEQKNRCLYTGKGIPLDAIIAADNRVQVDHILPFSRFGDNSFHNKTLCYTNANQQKKNRTAFEWIESEQPNDWSRFKAEVESCDKLKGLKKRNYLLMDASEVEAQWRARNLNDTRYALRVVLALLSKKYPNFEDGFDKAGEPRMQRRVFARPGAITSALRRVWGLESYKFDPETKKRINDDRHHALDAIITACCSESLLQNATRHAQQQKQNGESFELRYLPTPWGEKDEFRSEVLGRLEKIFVSRPERKRIRGEGHAATIKQIRNVDGKEKLFKRKLIDDLKLSDLDLIPIPKPYGNIKDPAKLRNQMVETLREWIEEKSTLKEQIKASKEKPEDAVALKEKLSALQPLSPKGDPIKKVRLMVKDKPAVQVRGGSADRSEMVRVDVFSKENKSGKKQHFLVPIYRTDYYSSDESLKSNPPNRAITANRPEDEWPIIDDTYSFKFSLYSYSLIEIVKPDGEILFGYYRTTHRGTGAINISEANDSGCLKEGIGARTLVNFKKFHVDRLGNYHEIDGEVRTWRGRACT